MSAPMTSAEILSMANTVPTPVDRAPHTGPAGQSSSSP